MKTKDLHREDHREQQQAHLLLTQLSNTTQDLGHLGKIMIPLH